MADEFQVSMLKRSVEEWNQWRRRASTIWERRPDLTSADLSNANLNSVDLSGANLHSSILWKANLNTANLRGAQLLGANLSWATLSFADLRESNLQMARLEGADLVNARLDEADLSDAYILSARLVATTVKGTRFDRARVGMTYFVDLDLTLARGLETCIHRSASVLDHRTLWRSKSIPKLFLRGCGLPERLIEHLPSLSNEPVQFYTVFISFSTLDQDFADRLHADLQNNGVRCWFAPHDILPGKKIHEQIDEAIRVYDRLLLILSEHSMASDWVKTEIANALQKQRATGKHVLFPIALVPFESVRAWKNFDADIGKDSAREIREYYIPDFGNWKAHDSYKAAFDKLLKGLKAEDAERR